LKHSLYTAEALALRRLLAVFQSRLLAGRSVAGPSYLLRRPRRINLPRTPCCSPASARDPARSSAARNYRPRAHRVQSRAASCWRNHLRPLNS